MALSGSIKTNGYEGRYYTLSWTATQSVANNASTVSWAISCAGGSASWYAERTLKAVINGTTVYSKTNRVERKAGTIKTGSITIPHNTDGSKSFSMSIQVACYTTSVNLTKSGSFTLNDIPRAATITSAPNFDDTLSPTLKYNNAAGNAVDKLEACISLDGSTDDIAYRDISKTGSSYTFSLTDAERNTLRNATTTANSRTVRFYIQTTISGNVYRNYVEKTFTVVNAKPTVSPTVIDSNATTTALTGNSSTFIKYYSNAEYTIGAAAKKGATITSQKIKVGNKSGTAANGTINAVESGSFIFSATDSRGNTVSKTLSQTLINYVKPTCNLIVAAPTTDGNLTITIRGACFGGSFGAVKNTISVAYMIKTSSDTVPVWNGATPIINLDKNTYEATVNLTGLDYRTTYTIQARISDKLSTKTSAAKTVKTMPVFDWGADDFQFNVPVYLGNSNQIYSKDTNGNDVMMISLNSSNQSFFGYGSYLNNLGSTYFDGHSVYIRSKNNINNTAEGTIGGNKAWTNSSDSRLKTDIADIPDVFSRVWFELMPRMFRWSDINGNDGKYHFGLIAQDVIEVFSKYGLNYEDYGFVSTIPIGDTDYYAITYEYYNILTAFVLRQALTRIEALEQKLQGE